MRKAIYLTTAAILIAAFGLVSPGAATASTTYNMLKTTKFSSAPAEGWSTCQSEDVTLAAPGSSNSYEWDEDYPTDTGPGLDGYGQPFSGKYYWTVCVASMKGISSNWTYFEYSLLTAETSTCENTGHCTEYELETHYIRQDVTANVEWGSQLILRPTSWCTYEACEYTGAVSVTHT